MTRLTRHLVLSLLAVSVSACAVRLGGPSPEDYDVAAMLELRDTDAEAVADRIRSAGAEIVLLAGERQDSAWFAYVAYRSGLVLSGPGATSGRGYAFLTTPSLEILGDTSLVLPVQGGGSLHMHDALYRIDEYRNIDLMIVRLDDSDLRESVRTLLDYIANDVPADAPLLLVLDGPTAEAAASVATMVRATLGDAHECGSGDSSAAQPVPEVRLLYGPSARVRCESARILPGSIQGIVARLEVGR